MEKRGAGSRTFYFNEHAEIKNRGQTTVYIILALVIVVLAVVLYFFYPKIGSILGGDSEPDDYMRTCLQPALEEGMDLVSRQGGYIDPEGYVMYQGNNVKYLCYTSHYYLPCYVQQPLLVPHVEKELSEYLEGKARDCAREIRDYYEERGYEVTGGNTATVDVDIAPDRVGVTVDSPMTFTKETTQDFKVFRFGKASKMYSLLMTAVSIIDFESTYGDAEVTIYMQYYPDLQIRKVKAYLGDGGTIYTIKNVKTLEEFTFASRSLAWPGGYGLSA
ncbi:MAG: hypothetical protein ABH864_04380 [archaeon]